MKIGHCVRCKRFSFDLQPWRGAGAIHCPDCVDEMRRFWVRIELEDLCRELRLFCIRLRVLGFVVAR